MKPMRDEILGEASQAIWVLQVAVGFVLLIACANLGEPVARPCRSTASRIRGTHRSRRRPRPAAPAVHDRRCAVVAGRRRPGIAARARGRAGAAARLSDKSAADERRRRRFARVAVYVCRVDGNRRDLRARAPSAYPHEGHGDRAQGRRRARCHAIGAPSHSPRARDGRGGVGRDPRDRRGLAAADGLQPHDARRRVRSIAPGDLLHDAAQRQLPAALRARADVSEACSRRFAPCRVCRRRPPCRACRRIVRSTRTTPTSTTTRLRRKDRTRTSTTTRTSCPTISKRWAFRSFRAAAFNRPTPRRPAWWRSSTKLSSTHSGRGAIPSDCACGRAAARRFPGSPSSAWQRTSSRAASIRRQEPSSTSSSTRRRAFRRSSPSRPAR